MTGGAAKALYRLYAENFLSPSVMPIAVLGLGKRKDIGSGESK